MAVMFFFSFFRLSICSMADGYPIYPSFSNELFGQLVQKLKRGRITAYEMIKGHSRGKIQSNLFASRNVPHSSSSQAPSVLVFG